MEKKSDIDARLHRLESASGNDPDHFEEVWLNDYVLNRGWMCDPPYDNVFWRISLSNAYCKFREDPDKRGQSPTFQEMRECLSGDEYDDLVRTLREMEDAREQLRERAWERYIKDGPRGGWHLLPEEYEARKRLREERKPLVVVDGKARCEDQAP